MIKLFSSALLLCFALQFQYAYSYKIVLMVLDVSNSQLGFNIRVGETLTRAGHDVTLLRFIAYDGRDDGELKIDKNIKVKNVEAKMGLSKQEIVDQQAKFIFKDFSYTDIELWKASQNSSRMFQDVCKHIAVRKDLVEWLKEEKFDLAMPHMYSLCSLGLIHKAEIQAWIWLNSAFMMDFIAYIIGPPIIPSYVPPMMMAATDEMNFYERTKSLLGHAAMYFLWPVLIGNKETAMYRDVYGPDFPDLYDIARECPLAILNSNEMFEFPRPLLAKTVYIGGLGMGLSDESKKPLHPEFQALVDKSKSIIVFTFGSVAPAYRMPDDWKAAFWSAFGELTDYTFIIRYEKPEELKGKLPPNVHASKWIPQTDLLLQPKAKLLITHGGYNSLQEAITTGIPLVAIPLFGDQPKNGKIIESRHFGVTLEKSEVRKDKLKEAIKKVVEDNSYKAAITRTRNMIKKRPVSPENLLVKWVEFVAEFKTLENLRPKGQDLNFFVYHSIDVIAFLLFVVFIILYIVYLILKLICRCFVGVLRKLGIVSKQKVE